MAEILVVDDERVVRDGLKAFLTEEGFGVRTARSGEEALAKFRQARPDLVLLDVMMSKRNGFSVCEEIRRTDSEIPVIFLTGLDGETQEIKGMVVGGDDYILKSAPREVMLARIRRSIERSRPRDTANGANTSSASCEGKSHANSMAVGHVQIDFTRRIARFDDGREPVKVTGIEIAILRALDTDRSRYFTNAEICAMMHGEDHASDPVTLRSQISRLKTKLGPSGELIRSERFLGYRLLA